MDRDQDSIRRLEALETRIAYQDQTIEDLNAAVTEQWKEIDALKRLVAGLTEAIDDLEAGARLGAPKEPPPPHY